MDISTNSYNTPVGFYNKNTGNTIGYLKDDEKILRASDVFSNTDFKENIFNSQKITRKKRKSLKRLNTIDSDYLPDEINEETSENICENFFMVKPESEIIKKIKKISDFIFSSVPLVNYNFLKNKEKNIKNTIEKLNGLNQNIDDLLSTPVPYGEESSLYDKIAENLTDAAEIIGKSNKEFKPRNEK